MSASSAIDLTQEEWIARLRAWNIRPSRGKGQNFLVESSVVEQIVDGAHIRPGETVVEVGPGMGILTGALLNQGAVVHAIELDDVLAPRLRHHFRQFNTFHLHHDNAATVDISTIVNGDSYKVVANLPYSVGTLIIRHFLESSQPPDQLTVMVQSEVAQRMSAPAGEMSLLALAVQLFAETEVLFDVAKESFYPAPRVSSSVARLDVREHPLLEPAQRDRLFSLATIAFQQRRKTLVNSLSRGIGVDKLEVSNALADIGIDTGVRPQAVSIDDWLQLATSWPFTS